jgi:hypothetical protein
LTPPARRARFGSYATAVIFDGPIPELTQSREEVWQSGDAAEDPVETAGDALNTYGWM